MKCVQTTNYLGQEIKWNFGFVRQFMSKMSCWSPLRWLFLGCHVNQSTYTHVFCNYLINFPSNNWHYGSFPYCRSCRRKNISIKEVATSPASLPHCSFTVRLLKCALLSSLLLSPRAKSICWHSWINLNLCLFLCTLCVLYRFVAIQA